MVIDTVENYETSIKCTELNIRNTNTKYSSTVLTVPMAEWLAYFPFDSYIPGSSRVGRNFVFQKNKPTEMCLKSTFPSPFSRHSATIQSPFS